MASRVRQHKGASRSDVAKLAGVAPTTVSAVLNGRGEEFRLSAATRRRVEEAARELRYVPNAAARALRRQGSRTLGLLWAPGFRGTLEAAAHLAQELGYFVVLVPTPGPGQDAISAVRDAGIAGLLCPTGSAMEFGDELEAAGIPVIWLDPYADDNHRRATTLGIDNLPGSADLAARLRDRGCRRVVVLGGPDSALPDGDPRTPISQRYRPLVEEFGDSLTAVRMKVWGAVAAEKAIQQLLADGPVPDAVFAANDQLAAGALGACQRAGLRVPDDIAVVGFGDTPISQVLAPRLTTIAWPVGHLARRGIRDLVLAVNRGDTEAVAAIPDTDEPLRTALVARDSA